MNRENSNKLFNRAINVIPGGVNSPVRACKSVGTEPVFIDHAEGCMIYDADGNGFIDYIGSWGPMILGHRHSAVIKAIASVLNRGTSFGAPTDLEIVLAEIVIEAVPSIEMVRMVNSGTEATMSAIRLARGVTGRDTIIKFDGCYHGHADTLLVEAGSGVATLGIPGSPGVPESFVAHTLSLPYNDIDSVRKLMDEQGDKIACIIVEPVAGNMGLVRPVEGFLETLREVTEKSGSILIFDEVMTGFRVAYGGAQSLYGISPDITCLGKIIGGGLPVGAYGGKREIMEHIAPQGPVYQAGTLSGNPLAMAAGIATLKQLKKPGFYELLDKKADVLATGLAKAAADAGINVTVDRVGSMLGMFFTDIKVKDFEDAKTSDLAMFSAYYKGMLEKGIYLAPSQFEALFVSIAHGTEHIDKTIKAAEEVLKKLKTEG
ncbi:MAG: glutamate-1-semialdehyde 2,1-aminomutase [Proteobacteria bacterium]|nr:glutamate-1-semialdehyde-2,1-aminomutase [Desulfobacteraceae bacterium]MBU3980913.1 glutamate-1-semialdehyde 2,1-aminomutase [Pseudomonadota bacterium]MBU4013272.1 glutamate-1-semialdehyde 2,1-aminomutase [Pseudomonadota bacterium]MBU4068825.1 glutamate-1-semialdehyde 2,1-aminomutase [Pseudomonadota bacterium]MBU4101736.1 glutamate-1-semialdehyde 2,1-aminomutase [Pseudomonadota bacterium]